MCVNNFTRNRLTTIDQNVTYNYNNNNRRVSKTVNGTTTYFIYDGHMLLGEYDTNGNVLNEYIYLGSTPIAMTTSSKTYKVYADHLNTPRRVVDENNNIVWKWESRPFGETKPTGTLEFNLRFAGQYFDNETGIHYNINRDYNPIIGRYIQSDPIGFDGGFTTFAYVNGNPIMFVDLEGLFGGSDSPKIGRLTTCDGDSAFAAIREQGKFRDKKNYITSDSILSLSYSTNLYNFGIGCAGMASGMVFLDLYVDNIKRPDPISAIIKAVYIGKNNDYGKKVEVRYMSDGDIEVWRIK